MSLFRFAPVGVEFYLFGNIFWGIGNLRKILRRLTSLGAMFICAAAIIGTLAVMLMNPHSRKLFQGDWFAYLWVIAPYAAVGVISYLGRRSLLASMLGLVSGIVLIGIAITVLLPYLLDSGNNTGKAMSVGLVPLFQWPRSPFSPCGAKGVRIFR